MNPTIIATEAYRTDLRSKWQEWRKAQKYYPDRTTWWERHVKQMLRSFSRQKKAENKRDRKTMEEHLYNCIYDVLQSEMTHELKHSRL
jgi:hypothetical protein